MNTTTTLLIGFCAVDSGQILITDPSYVKDFVNDPDYAPTIGNDIHPYSYNGACGATLGDQQGGQLGFALGTPGAGVAVSSGYGDGYYPVLAEYNEDGRIARVTILFSDDEYYIVEDDESEVEDDDPINLRLVRPGDEE